MKCPQCNSEKVRGMARLSDPPQPFMRCEDCGHEFDPPKLKPFWNDDSELRLTNEPGQLMNNQPERK